MRVTSHLPKANSNAGTRRRLPDVPNDYDDDDENDTMATNARSIKRQKNTKPTTTSTTTTKGSTTAVTGTSTRGRRTTAAASQQQQQQQQQQQTPAKSQKPNQSHSTPIQTPGHVLRQQESPKTPYDVHKMINLIEEEETIRPVYETEALQITELCAFKVDHTAYNSYLYTGKMKVPLFSNIAREDYASSIGASAGKNIRVHRKPLNQTSLPFDLDGQGVDDDGDNDEDGHKKTTKQRVTRRGTTATTSQVTTRGGSNVCIVDEEPVGVRTRGARRVTNTRLPDWEFSLDDQEHDDFESDISDEYSEDDDNGTRMGADYSDDDSDLPLVTDSENDDEDDEDEDDEDQGDDTDGDDDDDDGKPIKPTRGRRPRLTTTAKTTSRQQVQQSRRHTLTPSAEIDSDEEVQLSQPSRLANTARKNATNAKPIQKTKTITQNLNAIAPPQPRYQTQQRMQPIPPPQSLNNNSNVYNSTTSEGQEHQIVNIVVKYPLMGSLDDWKDSFQTCQEEVVMYRQIQTWKCPFLLRYYGTHGPGLVFEYVDGESLDSLLFHASDVDLEAQTWMWSELGFHITTALLYLHKLNISHNDIKPENVRYSATKRCWKLLDLGLATDFDMKVSRQIGTDGYRSPEVAKTGHLNRKSDVFSLGVMMDDALERLVTRYQVLEDIYDEFEDIRQQYEEERKTKAYRQKGGEIDLDQEMQNVLTSYIKRRKMDSIHVNLENSRYTMAHGAKYVSFLEIARELIKAMLAEDPQDRPSVKRALACFKLMMTIESQLRDCLATLKMMGIY